MANGRLGQWLQMLVCVLILLETECFYVGIAYVQNAVAKGAVCLDGSPPTYHLDNGFGAGINNWLVHFEGKGIKLHGFSTRTTTYTKPLNPPAISFETKEGGAMLSEAMAEGTAEGSLKLLANYGMQRDLNFCGLASLCTVLNALRVDPKRAWKGPWRWFEDDMVGDSEIMGNIQKKGITFDNFAELARKHVDIEAFKAQYSSLDQFTDSVIKTTSVEDLHIILSYSRKKVNQTGDGHFSPMAAYHKGSDMLLILDVARYKYPFHWLPRMTVWDAMNQIDKETGETRGFMMVRKKSHEPELWRD